MGSTLSVQTMMGRAALAAGLVAVAGAAANAQCVAADIYGPPVTMSVGSLPLGIATGDVNNDGNPDVVTANTFGYTSSVLLGNGDGTFQSAITLNLVDPESEFAVGASVAAVGDLNNDGWDDIVIGVGSPDLGNPAVGVFINDGAGGFPALPTYYAFANQIRGVVIADMDEDGDNDIVYSNRDDNSLNIIPNNGDGTFGFEDIFTFFGGPAGLVVRDFNGDGDLDVAMPLVFDSQIVIALGNGAGGVTELVRYTANSPEGLAVGDFNGDGNYDLVTPYLNGDAVQFFLGNGDGTFQAAQTISTGPSSLPIAIGAADANGDGFDDIHAGLFIANSVQLILSNGDGTFQSGVAFPVGSRPRYFAFDDFNNDGSIDLAAANGATTGTATVLINQCVEEPSCACDLDGEPGLTSSDFLTYLNNYAAMDPSADLAPPGGDGIFNSSDFLAYLNCYSAGC
ncbi:MAG: VCBS repeat-containing protein [Phycisphaerales bacterium]|jgi:hypothetical protein|nr:VCBS repeat-containing protein [Phycisphaerales bacterium]